MPFFLVIHRLKGRQQCCSTAAFYLLPHLIMAREDLGQDRDTNMGSDLDVDVGMDDSVTQRSNSDRNQNAGNFANDPGRASDAGRTGGQR